MKKTAIAIAAILLLALGMPGCGTVLIGSGHLTTREFDIKDFTGVDISSAFEFDIAPSDSYMVKITTDDNILERVSVTKDGNTLKIRLRPIFSLGPATLKASITMPQLDKISASGASRGTLSDFSSTRDFDIALSGASQISGDIIAGNIKLDISGASTAMLAGVAEAIVASVSGASSLNMGKLSVNNADITLSGASTGEIECHGWLDANLSGASRLFYTGEPAMGDINTSGASTLSKK